MIVHLLKQFASSALLLLFGVLALGVWRRFGTVRRDRSALAWAVTAASFLVVGVYATAHAVISPAAIAAGKGTWLYGFVTGWVHETNAGRGVATVCFGLLMTALMVVPRRTAPRVAAAAPVAMTAAVVAGTVGVRLLPEMTPHGFFTTMAVLYALTAMALMAALLAAVQNDGMDQLLWLALAAYALKETLGVSLLGVISFWGVADVGPYYAALYWLQLGMGCLMAGLAARRLRLASGGRRVPALFERVHALRRPAHG